MIKHNATSGEDLGLAKAHIRAWRNFAKGQNIEIKYLKASVHVTVDGEVNKMPRDVYQQWADEGFPVEIEGEDTAADVTPEEVAELADEVAAADTEAEPEPEPDTRRKGSKRSKKAVVPADAEDAPDSGVAVEEAGEVVGTPEASAALEDSGDLLSTIALEAFETVMQERQGARGKNVARFERGEQMVRLNAIARSQRIPMKEALVELNKRLAVLAGENMVPDFSPIGETEATITRKVVETYGSSGEFKLVNAINRATGDPLVNDSGEPLDVALTDVAMNKLYIAIEFADDSENAGDWNQMLSFLHRNTEAVVRAARTTARKTGKSFRSIIKTLDKARMPEQHVADGSPIKVQLNETESLKMLASISGDAPPVEVAAIKTSRAWFDSTWKPVKAMFAAVLGEFRPELMDKINKEASNVTVLEALITQYYNVYEDDGVQRVLGAMVDAELIDAQQAGAFIDSFAFDPQTTTWVPVGELPEQAVGSEDESDDEDAGFEDTEDDAGDEADSEDAGFEEE